MTLLAGHHFCGVKDPDPHAVRISFSHESLDRLQQGLRLVVKSLWDLVNLRDRQDTS